MLDLGPVWSCSLFQSTVVTIIAAASATAADVATVAATDDDNTAAGTASVEAHAPGTETSMIIICPTAQDQQAIYHDTLH